MKYSKTPVVFLFALFFASAQTFADTTAARVVSVQGKALVRADNEASGAADSALQLKVGDSVNSGQVINTASDGRVKLLFDDKSIIDIGPSSLFKVSEYKKNAGSDRQVDVEMKYGSIRAAVAKKIKGDGHFRVKTPTATMGVRGTEFLVNAPIPTDTAQNATVQATQTQVTVVQGAVAVDSALASGNASPSLLTQGMAVSAGMSQSMEVQKVDVQNVQVMKNESTIVPQAFLESVQVSTNAGGETMKMVGDSVKIDGNAGINLGQSGLLGVNNNPLDMLNSAFMNANNRDTTVPVTVIITGVQ